MRLLLLLILVLGTGCATSPCKTLLDLDRRANVELFNGRPDRTITTEQFAEKDRGIICFALDFVMLPYDLFCAEEVLNHCDYWKRREHHENP